MCGGCRVSIGGKSEYRLLPTAPSSTATRSIPTAADRLTTPTAIRTAALERWQTFTPRPLMDDLTPPPAPPKAGSRSQEGADERITRGSIAGAERSRHAPGIFAEVNLGSHRSWPSWRRPLPPVPSVLRDGMPVSVNIPNLSAWARATSRKQQIPPRRQRSAMRHGRGLSTGNPVRAGLLRAKTGTPVRDRLSRAVRRGLGQSYTPTPSRAHARRLPARSRHRRLPARPA